MREIHAQKADNVLADAAQSFMYSAFEQPLAGAIQLVDDRSADRLLHYRPRDATTKSGWVAQQIGSGLGMALDLYFGKMLVGGVSNLAAKEAVDVGAASVIRRSAVTGAIYGAFFQPVEHDSASNFWVNRVGNAATSALAMTFLSGTAVGAKTLGVAAGGGIGRFAANDMVGGLLGSIPAGFASAEGSSLSAGHGFASKSDVEKSMASFAITGVTLGGLHAFSKSINPLSKANTTPAGSESVQADGSTIPNLSDNDHSNSDTGIQNLEAAAPIDPSSVKALADRGVPSQSIEAVIRSAEDAGISQAQLVEPHVARTVADVSTRSPEMMKAAGVSLRVMGPEKTNASTVKAIHLMTGANWTAEQITPADVKTAQAIINTATQLNADGWIHHDLQTVVSRRIVNRVLHSVSFHPDENVSVPMHLQYMLRETP